MIRTSALVWLLLAAGMGACSKGGGVPAESRLQPPAGTGAQVIDMEGDWQIVALEHADDPTLALPYPDPGAGLCQFLPLERGRVFSIRQGALRDGLGAPMLLAPQPGPQDRYLNVADGQVAWFELHQQTDAGCYSFLTIQAAFGSVDTDAMQGLVSIRRLSTCQQGQFLMPDPNGLFRVSLERVAPIAPPAGTGQLAIDMNGTWRIDLLERLDSPAALPIPGVGVGACDFLPLQEGREFTVRHDRLVGPTTGLPLLEQRYYGAGDRYENMADGRELRLLLFSSASYDSCRHRLSVRAAFGSASAHALHGIVEITGAAVPGCLPNAVVAPRPEGRFRVSLVRL